MRRAVCLSAILLSLVASAGVAEAQTARPQFRPAVLGTGPDSLINRIDAKALAAKGQGNGAVMFCAFVRKTGVVQASWTYRPMPGSEALEEEVSKRLIDLKCAPALYQHQPVDVLLYGTALFSIAEGTPLIRIYLNQDPRELKTGSDFIGPQPVVGGDSKFDGLNPPNLLVQLNGVVDVALKVDDTGELRDFKVVGEEPPLSGFGLAAMEDFKGAKFIPAFRNGFVEASETLFPVCYKLVE